LVGRSAGPLNASDDPIVPAHWPAEVANAVLMSVRRGRISSDKAARFFEDLRALPIRVDPHSSESTFGRVFALAVQHRVTIYDAAYLELAIRLGLPLVTLDDELRNAAMAAGVPLL
jgi:predicted nucleic acid-binding protein